MEEGVGSLWCQNSLKSANHPPLSGGKVIWWEEQIHNSLSHPLPTTLHSLLD
jgi:hypothetical protein